MDDQQKTLLLLVLIVAILFCASRAHAEAAAPVMPPNAAPAEVASTASSDDQLAAMHEIRSAARRLERAALQWDFSSNTEELALLQSAHDWVAPAIRRLCCTQRARAVQLESDIDYLIVRARTRLGPLLSTTGASYGPPAPSRDQLAQLAVEAQDLAREAPVAHRLIEMGNRDSPSQTTSDAQSGTEPDPVDYANPDSLSWPPRRSETAPQFNFRF